MKFLRTLILTLLLSCTLACCPAQQPPEPQYGREYNPERRKAGVPIIPENWELEKVLTGESLWVNPDRIEDRAAGIPTHWSKHLNYRTGELLAESDIYLGKEDYTTPEGTRREYLSSTYRYQVDEYDDEKKIGWEFTLYSEESPLGKKLSLEEAQEVLTEWNLEFP